MPQFRKKPVVIEAMQFTDANKDRVFNWITCNAYPSTDIYGKPVLLIETLEGKMTASLSDWVIKGIKSEFYPCKDEIFQATYEAATSETAHVPLVDVLEYLYAGKGDSTLCAAPVHCGCREKIAEAIREIK